jgi:hypothetical protein
MGRGAARIVEGFLEALGRPRLKPGTLEALEKGEWSGGWYADTGRDRMDITVELGRDRWGLSLPVPPGTPYFKIEKWGESTVEVSNFFLRATEGRAFFKARRDGDGLPETLALVRGLKPLFQALGLGDLEEALLALGDLETGAKARGPYVLISDTEREVLALRRGSLFGDLSLDKAFLTEGRAVMTYPEGEITLSGRVSATNDSLIVLGFRIRWRDEVFPEDGGLLPVKLGCPVLAADVIPCLLREAARAASLKKLPRPPALKELLWAIEGSEDPIRSLRDESFLRELKLRLLSRL